MPREIFEIMLVSVNGESGSVEYGLSVDSCALLIFGKNTQKNNIAAKTKMMVTDIASILLSMENGTFFYIRVISHYQAVL